MAAPSSQDHSYSPQNLPAAFHDSSMKTCHPSSLHCFSSTCCFTSLLRGVTPVMWIKTLWKILKEKGIPDHLTCHLKNLYAGQEATVRTGHGTTGWFQIGKGVRHGCILSPCLLNLYAEYKFMRNTGLDEHKLESRLPGEISTASDIQKTPSLRQKVKN